MSGTCQDAPGAEAWTRHQVVLIWVVGAGWGEQVLLCTLLCQGVILCLQLFCECETVSKQYIA